MTQPADEPLMEGSSEDERTVPVELLSTARSAARPLARVAVVLALLVMILLINERSAATPEHSLRTSGDRHYVEQIRFDGIDARSPAAADTAADTTAAATGPDPALTTTTTPAPAIPTSTDPVADAGPAPTLAPPTAPTMEPGATVGQPPVPGGSDDDMSRGLPDPLLAVEAPQIVSPWADRTTTTSAGYVATDIGCATGTSAAALDAFFRERMGPVLGLDYQHVYPLGGSRYLWLFQDTFIDYSGLAANLGQAVFAHNTAMVQDGACFTLYHRGAITAPTSFEDGTGENWKAKWWWPMGGETVDGKVYVFWAQMEKDGYDPTGPNGLGWHPVRTWLAVYSAKTLQRLWFAPAPNAGVNPVYGYAVASDGQYTYLFGNTFEQNLVREGGFANGPHSATRMFLARVPLGQFGADPEYRSGDTWTGDPAGATPITQRSWAENPMQPRFLSGQWVAATKLDGYWGESLAIDVANDPWGPWTTVEQRGLAPRGGDPLMNTYQAHLMPWLDPSGTLVVSVSQNARNMRRDAWPNPNRYRLMFFRAALVTPPPREQPAVITIEETTIVPETSTTVADTTTTVTTTPTTTAPATTTTTPATTPPTTTPPTTTTTTTTTAPATTTTEPATTTTAPAATTSTVNPTTTVGPTSSTVDPNSTSSSTGG